MVIEWAKNSRERYEWDGEGFRKKLEDLPAPVNYGFVPGTLNPADGSEVDAALLGPPVAPKARYEGELVGAVTLADGDHKLILSPGGRPPSEEEIRALLSWFEAIRAPRLIGKEEAERLFLGIFGREGEDGRGGQSSSTP